MFCHTDLSIFISCYFECSDLTKNKVIVLFLFICFCFFVLVELVFVLPEIKSKAYICKATNCVQGYFPKISESTVAEL